MNKSLERRTILINIKEKLEGDFYSLPLEARYTKLLSEIVTDEEQLYRSVKKFVKKYIDVHGDFFIKLDFDNSIEQICEQYGQDLENEDYRDKIIYNGNSIPGITFPQVFSDKLFKSFYFWDGDDYQECHLYYDLTLKEFGLKPKYLSGNYFQNKIFFREIFTNIFTPTTIITLLKFLKKKTTLKQLVEAVQSDIVTEVKGELTTGFVDVEVDSTFYLSYQPCGLHTEEEYFERFTKIDFDFELMNYKNFKDSPGIVYIQKMLNYKSKKFDWKFVKQLLLSVEKSVFHLFLSENPSQKERLDFVLELLRHWMKDDSKVTDIYIWRSNFIKLCEEEFNITSEELYDELERYYPNKFNNFINKILGNDYPTNSRKKSLHSVKHLFRESLQNHYFLKRLKVRDNVSVEKLTLPVQIDSSFTTTLTELFFHFNSNLKVNLLFYNLLDQEDKNKFYHSVINKVHELYTEYPQLEEEKSQVAFQIPKLAESEIDTDKLNQMVRTISESVTVEEVSTEFVTGENQIKLNNLYNQISSYGTTLGDALAETERQRIWLEG